MSSSLHSIYWHNQFSYFVLILLCGGFTIFCSKNSSSKNYIPQTICPQTIRLVYLLCCIFRTRTNNLNILTLSRITFINFTTLRILSLTFCYLTPEWALKRLILLLVATNSTSGEHFDFWWDDLIYNYFRFIRFFGICKCMISKFVNRYRVDKIIRYMHNEVYWFNKYFIRP